MNNFITLKRQIEKLLQKAEDEALENGVNITSTKFQSVFRELKRKILAERGISLEEYERLEEEIERDGSVKVDKNFFIKVGKGLEKETEEEKGKINENIGELRKDLLSEISILKEEEDSKIQSLTEKTDAEKRELLKENEILQTTLKEQEITSGKQAKELKKIGELEEKFQREALRENRNIDNVKDLVKRLPTNKDIEDIKKEIRNIPKPEKQVLPNIKKEVKEEIKNEMDNLQEMIDKRINDLAPRFLAIPSRKGGLESSNIIDAETPTGSINGSNKTFTLAYTPNPTTSLKVFRNGIRQELTTHYTLSGKTLTTVAALPTGTNLKVEYRK